MKLIRRQKDSTPAENHPEPVNGATIPLAQALADHLNGNIEGALAKLNSLDGEDGNIADVVAAKAHLLLRANRFEEAQRQFARLISIMPLLEADRKSTRLNSSHLGISYAVFCLKKKL